MTSPVAVTAVATGVGGGSPVIMAEAVGGGGGGGGVKRSSADPKTTPTYHTVIISLTSGAMAGAVARTVIAPLDRTKIYFQTHPDKSYRLQRAFKYIHTTCKTEGVLFLWRGNSATMARIVPYAAFQFLAHDQYKRILGIHAEQHKHLSPDVARTEKIRHFLAGSLAGATGQALTYPLDRARAVMAVTRIGEYKNLMDVFRRTVAVEGWASLYRGFVPTILGVIPYAGTSFFTYEQLKAFWINRARRSGDLEASQPTTLQKFCSGALAGLLGQTASYPLDIVRRRMQTATQMGVSHNKYASVLGTLTFVLRKEGIRKGWYKGVSMNFIKGPISVGTSFLTYDICSSHIKKMLNK